MVSASPPFRKLRRRTFDGDGGGRVPACRARKRAWPYADGRATVFCGAQSTGQGHATSLAQVAASVLGIALDDIEVVEGDTQAVPFGTGTFNSRSMAIGGSAVYEAARKIMDKARGLPPTSCSGAHVISSTRTVSSA